jgi:hypothetical protein
MGPGPGPLAGASLLGHDLPPRPAAAAPPRPPQLRLRVRAESESISRRAVEAAVVASHVQLEVAVVARNADCAG